MAYPFLLVLLALLSGTFAQQLSTSGLDALDLLTPSSEIEDLPGACNCTATGISGVASVDNFEGCNNFMSANGDDTYYCYVVDPVNCPPALSSPRFVGAGYRGCNPKVDAVVKPGTPVGDLWSLVQNTPSLSYLAEALERSNLTDLLSSAGPGGEGYTLFAPSNYAFQAIASGYNITVDEVLDTSTLLALLLGHIVPGTYNLTEAAEAGAGDGLATLSPAVLSNVMPTLQEGVTVTDTAIIPFTTLALGDLVYGTNGYSAGTVATGNVAADNGYLYIINSMFAIRKDIVTSLAGDSSFSTFSRALNVSGVGDMLSQDCPDALTANCSYLPVTVFAPTNSAFSALASGMGLDVEDVLALPELADILLYHFTDPSVVTSLITPADLEPGMEIATLYEEADISVVWESELIPVQVDLLTGDALVANVTTVQLVGANNASTASVDSSYGIVGYNGIALAIDQVLLPFTVREPATEVQTQPSASEIVD